MKKSLILWMEKLDDWKGSAFPYFLLAIIGYAFYNVALRFAPVDFDDLVLLSSAKAVKNPLQFFIGDWGFGNYGYRPLHSLSLWLSYCIFGVSSGPAQLINLLLHIAVILLLYILLVYLLTPKHWVVAFLLSGLAMVSLYTVSGATWVSDRPTLFVTFFLLIMLNYLARVKEKETPKAWILLLLSLLALLSKESGLILPLIALYFLVFELRTRLTHPAIWSLVILLGAYGLLRFVIFGSNAATYTEAGYLFGRTYYENLGTLQGGMRIAAYVENVVKNILAVFLPIFDGQGKLSLIGTKMNSLVVAGCTLLIFLLSLGKKLTRFQRVSLVIILLNGLIHLQLFRYRVLYIPQMAFVIFAAASDQLKEESKARRAILILAAALLLFWNMKMIGENLDLEMFDRMARVRETTFKQDILATSNRIDSDIVMQIIHKYRH
jgi:4-amino-4-deoxy-L-arabinose transferase-like glycosyltransferase